MSLAGRTMTIRITNKDIQNGKRRDVNQCPIALAVNRHMKQRGYKPFIVTFIHMFDNVEDQGTWARLPEKAQCFVSRFDNGRPIGPFTLKVTFELKKW